MEIREIRDREGDGEGEREKKIFWYFTQRKKGNLTMTVAKKKWYK